MLYCLKCATPLNSIIEDNFSREKCPKCEYVYYNNPRPCVTAIIMQSEYIMLALRKIEPAKGQWDLPGGFMEAGEHPEESIRREVKEELNVGLSEVKLFGIYPNIYDQTEPIHTVDITYLCQIEDEPSDASGEIDAWHWFHLSDLPDTFAFPSVTEIIQDVKNLFGF